MRLVKKAASMAALWLCAAVLLAAPCSGTASLASGQEYADRKSVV